MYVQRAFSVYEVSPRHLVYVLQDTTAHEEPNEALNFPVLLGHTTTEQDWNERKTVYPA